MDQAGGAKWSGPHNNYVEELIWSIHKVSILAATKFKIIQHALRCPSMPMGSQVILLGKSYFEQHLLPKIKLAMSEKANAHKLFKLMVTNDGQLLSKMYTKLDITFLGLKVLNVGMLIIDNPSQVLDKKHQSKLPSIVGGNLVWLSYNMFVKKYGTSEINSFYMSRGS